MVDNRAAYDDDFVRVFRAGTISTDDLERLLRRVTGYIRTYHIPVYPEADDIASEAVLLAYDRIDTFRGEGGFLNWLLGIARNVARDRGRKLGRASMPFPDTPTCVSTTAEDLPPDFDEACLRTWALEAAVDSLKDEEQAVIRMRILEQCPSREVAERLGKSDAAVRQTEHRACLKMRRFLYDNGYADLFARVPTVGPKGTQANAQMRDPPASRPVSMPPARA